jgi:ribosomal protein S18 acetylase RimI-like enzyme
VQTNAGDQHGLGKVLFALDKFYRTPIDGNGERGESRFLSVRIGVVTAGPEKLFFAVDSSTGAIVAAANVAGDKLHMLGVSAQYRRLQLGEVLLREILIDAKARGLESFGVQSIF